MKVEPTVLVVGHDVSMSRLLRRELTAAGLRVVETQQDWPSETDIAVLDLDPGVELMHQVRRALGVNLPVILLTPENPRDRIRGLELGADDALSRPFVPEELVARIRAVLRRSLAMKHSEGVVRGATGLEIDMLGRVARRDEQIIPLTRTEWRLLHYLASNPGKIVTNSEIIRKVWGDETKADAQYLRVWIARLRRKIELRQDEPEIVRTYQGVGYMFMPEEAADEDGDAGPRAGPLAALAAV